MEASEQLQVFVVSTLRDAASWPEFTTAADAMGVKSALSVPLVFGAQALGVVNLYSREAHAFDHCREVSLIFAAQAAAAVVNAELRDASERLTDDAGHQWASSDVADQAKELLMAGEGSTVEEALDVLRQRWEANR